VKTHLVAAVVSGFLLAGSGMPSAAANRCEGRVRKAEQARRNFIRERSNCRNNEQDDLR
jgi:hypothetical protein